MHDLIGFLKARLQEDEDTALAVQDNSAPWRGQWRNDGGHAIRTENGWVLAYRHHGVEFPPGLLDHIAHNDPARVFDEVESKRAIIDGLGTYEPDDPYTADTDLLTDLVLKGLALAYQNHPDFKDEWRLPTQEPR